MFRSGKDLGDQMGSAEKTNTFKRVFASKDKVALGRILLLEDDPLTGEWLATSLSKKSLEVHWCQDLMSSLDALRQQTEGPSFHAVITDLYIRDQGAEGMQLLKAAQDEGLPVGIISSRPDLPIVMEALNKGASVFLQKPFEIDEIFHKILSLWEEPKHLPSILERFMEQNRLTEKERDVCRLLFKGLSNKEIATVLNVTEKTIKFHVTGIFEKCGVQSRSELASTVFPI